MALIETLYDTFSGTTLSANWSPTGGVTVDDELILEASFSNNADITSIDGYTLDGSQAFIKIIDAGTAYSNIFFSPLYLSSGSRDLYWQIYNNNIYAYDGATVKYSAAYDEDVHVWVRIREASGTIYYDTSVNGTSWTNRATSTSGTLPEFGVSIMNNWTGTPFLDNEVILDNFNTTATTRYRTISGSIRFSGFVTRPEAERPRSISGSISFFGNVVGTKQQVFTDVERKSYLYKVYDEDDEFLELWPDVVNEIRLPEELNTAGSAITVELARNSDTLITGIENLLDSSSANILDSNSQVISTVSESPNQIGDGSSVDYNNRVDVYVFYGFSDALLDSDGIEILDSNFEPIIGTTGSPNGVRIYSGFISDISSRYGSTETTVVTLMSFGWDLDQYVVSSGSNTTVAFSSDDPSDIVRDGLTAFQVASGSNISFNDGTVLTTGTTTSYTFKVNTYLELLKKAVELAPSDWFYFLDQGTQLINFRDQSTTPDHYFHLGKHIKDLDLRGNIENVINDVYFVGGETAGVALYERFNRSPATRTRRGLRRLTDSRVLLSTTAELLSESEMDRNNQILYRSTVTILDKVYDIERIQLGQMIGFRNFGNYIDELQLQVVGRTYTPEYVELQLGTLLPKITKRVSDIKRNLDANQTEFVPTAPS